MNDKAKKVKNTTKTGNLGETIASEYLVAHGHTILERNFRKKYGEIDIISRAHDTVHFVEVKTTTHKDRAQLEWSVTHETWQPEELVHQFKLHQIEKTLEAWLQQHNWVGRYQIDVATVRIVPTELYACVKYLPQVV